MYCSSPKSRTLGLNSLTSCTWLGCGGGCFCSACSLWSPGRSSHASVWHPRSYVVPPAVRHPPAWPTTNVDWGPGVGGVRQSSPTGVHTAPSTLTTDGTIGNAGRCASLTGPANVTQNLVGTTVDGADMGLPEPTVIGESAWVRIARKRTHIYPCYFRTQVVFYRSYIKSQRIQHCLGLTPSLFRTSCAQSSAA